MEDTPENRIRFASIMGELYKAFGLSPDKQQMLVYFKFLSDRSFYQVESAVTQLIQTGDRFPTVAKIRELASAYREFKTVEQSESIQIEEFTTVDEQPHTADDFFRIVGELVGEKEIKPCG